MRICPLNVFNQTRALTQNQQCHDLSENTTCIIQTMDGPIFWHFWISFHNTEATKMAPIWRYAGFKCWLDFPSGENQRTFFSLKQVITRKWIVFARSVADLARHHDLSDMSHLTEQPESAGLCDDRGTITFISHRLTKLSLLWWWVNSYRKRGR